MRWLSLLLIPACGGAQANLRGDLGLAELVVCSPDGGRQVLVAESPEAFPEGALLEDGCATFEVTPGIWYIQVSELTCEGAWEEVEVTAPLTEHTADFVGCLMG